MTGETAIGQVPAGLERETASACQSADVSSQTLATLQAENDKLRAERDELQASVWTLEGKVDALSPHGTCGCAWDDPDDLCAHHSPKLLVAEAEVARLTSALAAEESRSGRMVEAANEWRSRAKAAERELQRKYITTLKGSTDDKS